MTDVPLALLSPVRKSVVEAAAAEAEAAAIAAAVAAAAAEAAEEERGRGEAAREAARARAAQSDATSLLQRRAARNAGEDPDAPQWVPRAPRRVS